jgi:hypothetical protein
MAARQVESLETIEASVIVGQNDFGHLVAGWHALEYVPYPIRWTSESSEFLIRTEGHQRLCVEAIALGRRSVRGRVEMEGRPLGAFDVGDRGWQTLCYRLPPVPPAGPVERGRIVTERPWVPAQGGMGADTRRLGIAVRRIWAEATYVARASARLRALFVRPATTSSEAVSETGH